MDAVREVCSAALSLRKARGLRVRLPLAALTVAPPDADALRPFADLLADEVNVKEVGARPTTGRRTRAGVAAHGERAGRRARGSARTCRQVIKAVKAGDWSRRRRHGRSRRRRRCVEGEYELELVAADAGAARRALPGGAGVVVLDTDGDAGAGRRGPGPRRGPGGAAGPPGRRAATSSDRIALTLAGPDAVLAAVRTHEAFVAGEVLAASVGFAAGEAGRPAR